jgi:hypothetical protein
MAGDLFGLSAADRDVLLRMIARERANYSANVRSLAPIPREKNIWKPGSTLKWFYLQGNAYPQSDLSPYNSSIWSTTGKEMEWDDAEKQWALVDPPVEETIYSTGCIYAMKDRVVPCQKATGGGYEIVTSDPPDACYFEAQNMSSFSTQGDLTGLSPSGYGFEEAAGTNTTKSGFLFLTHTFNRGYDPTGSAYVRAIEYQDATAPSTNGTFDVNFTGVWEIDIHIWGEIRSYYTGGGSNPRAKATSRTTGAASAGTAHTHTYDEWNYLGGNDPAPALQAVIWTKPSGGSYAEYTGLDMPVEHFPFASTSGVLRRNYSYRVRQACNLTEGDRLGIQLVSAALYACQMRMEGATVSFRLIMPGHANQVTA